MHTAALVALRVGLAAILVALLTHTRADPDLWGHVLFGGEIVRTGHIPLRDGFSFLSDRPWINHEWLSECTMYLAYALAGGVGLVFLKLALVAGMLGGVVTSLRGRVSGGAGRDLLIALVLIGTFAQANHVRPQIFSLAVFAWLLALLTTSRGPALRLLLIPGVMALWVNLHGGWMVGGGVLALWTASTLVSAAPKAEKALLLATGMLSLAATLLNPYGWRMWQFLWETVGFGRADIAEWQPVFRVGAAFMIAWSLLAMAAAAAILRSVRSGRFVLRHAAVVIALGLASFWVNRLLAFFAISLVVLLGPELAALRRPRPRALSDARQPPVGWALAVILGIACLAIGGGAAIAARNVGCVRMESAHLPEAEATAFAQDRHLQGRLLIWFDWGEYAIWHLGPSLSVSIDGRRETVYSNETLQRHLRFYFVPSTRAAFLADVRPDYIWLPPHLPVAQALLGDGWVTLYAGPRSVLLGKTGDAKIIPLRTAATPRCFPGP
jgi:hypothetical protein